MEHFLSGMLEQSLDVYQCLLGPDSTLPGIDSPTFQGCLASLGTQHFLATTLEQSQV